MTTTTVRKTRYAPRNMQLCFLSNLCKGESDESGSESDEVRASPQMGRPALTRQLSAGSELDEFPTRRGQSPLTHFGCSTHEHQDAPVDDNDDDDDDDEFEDAEKSKESGKESSSKRALDEDEAEPAKKKPRV